MTHSQRKREWTSGASMATPEASYPDSSTNVAIYFFFALLFGIPAVSTFSLQKNAILPVLSVMIMAGGLLWFR